VCDSASIIDRFAPVCAAAQGLRAAAAMNILRDTPTPLPEAHAPAGGHELPDDGGAGASGAALALAPPAPPPLALPPPPLHLHSQMCGGCWAALQARACPCCTPSAPALLARAPSPEPDAGRASCELLVSTDDDATTVSCQCAAHAPRHHHHGRARLLADQRRPRSAATRSRAAA
jgi:hypothetical protein